MKALIDRHRRMWHHQPLTVRLLAATAGLLTAAAAFAEPAEANPIDDTFIDALQNAGVDYGAAGNAVVMGQAICPTLAQPGGSFVSAASSIAGANGMSPQMAETFTSIAISIYCPTVIANVAAGNLPGLLQLPNTRRFRFQPVPSGSIVNAM